MEFIVFYKFTKYVYMKFLKQKITFAFAMSVWIGGVMFAGSIPLALLDGEGFYVFYFEEHLMFYQITMVISMVFIISFIFGHNR